MKFFCIEKSSHTQVQHVSNYAIVFTAISGEAHTKNLFRHTKKVCHTYGRTKSIMIIPVWIIHPFIKQRTINLDLTSSLFMLTKRFNNNFMFDNIQTKHKEVFHYVSDGQNHGLIEARSICEIMSRMRSSAYPRFDRDIFGVCCNCSSQTDEECTYQKFRYSVYAIENY